MEIIAHANIVQKVITGGKIIMARRIVVEEVEGCPCCNGVFLSPYKISTCVDHEGKVDIFTKVDKCNDNT